MPTVQKAPLKADKPAKPQVHDEAQNNVRNTVQNRPLRKGDHLFLVDGSSYIFRAYHALPPINRKSDGLQLNAVFGFCNMLWKLLRDMKPEEKPTHLAVVFDLSERTFRTEMYPDYKAHRPDPPDDLRPQFPLIREAVQAFDLPCLEQRGFEADDLIATYVREACEAGATATIVSSDKDLMQLVSDCVLMFDTMKDRKIGRAEVMEKFGVPPEKVVEVQALIGDSTDNVPGVPGIGVKTAAQLIGEYGDLETLLRRASEIKQEKRRQALIEHAENARLSKKLVTLDDHVKLDVPTGDLAVHEPDHKRLIAFLKAMEFNSLTRRVAEFAGIDAADIAPEARLGGGLGGKGATFAAPAAASVQITKPPGGTSPQLPLERPPQPADARRSKGEETSALTPRAFAAARFETAQQQKFDRSKYETIRSLDRLRAVIERARDIGFVAVAAQTDGLDPMQAQLCGFSLAVAPSEACYVPLAHRQQGSGGENNHGGLFGGGRAADQIEEAAALAALKPLLEDFGVLKIGHDFKFEFADLRAAGHRDRRLRRHHADVLRDRRRARRTWPRRIIWALFQSPDYRARRDYQTREEQDHLRLRRHRQSNRIFGRARRRHAATVASAQSPTAGRARAQCLREFGATAPSRIGSYGTARHLYRSTSAVAALRRVRAGSRRT